MVESRNVTNFIEIVIKLKSACDALPLIKGLSHEKQFIYQKAAYRALNSSRPGKGGLCSTGRYIAGMLHFCSNLPPLLKIKHDRGRSGSFWKSGLFIYYLNIFSVQIKFSQTFHIVLPFACYRLIFLVYGTQVQIFLTVRSENILTLNTALRFMFNFLEQPYMVPALFPV